MSDLKGPFIQINLEDEAETTIRIGRAKRNKRAGEADLDCALVQVQDHEGSRQVEIPLDQVRAALRTLGALL